MATVIYSDLDFLLEIDSSGNVKKKINNDAIVQSIKTILSTIPGERIMNPEFGSTLRYILFDPMDDITNDLIQKEIEAAIERWEDRIVVTEVISEIDYDRNYYIINIYYIIGGTRQRESFTAAIKSQA